METKDPKFLAWLQIVASHIGKVTIDGEIVDATPENLEECLQDEPWDCWEHDEDPIEYAENALLEYGTISNEEL